MAEKNRLDVLMLEKGLVPSRSRAEAYIMEGRVTVNGIKAAKPGLFISPDADIKIKESDDYVSRGGFKLKKALDEFKLDVKDKICLDVGASTGGFTDCLLRTGAKKVYCVDVGYGILDEKIKTDPRVVNFEKTNIRYFDKSLVKDDIDFVVIDVSFISLEKVLPAVKNLLRKDAEIIALVKPQFEAPRGSTKRGVVRDEAVRAQTIEKVKQFAVSLSFEVAGGVDSPIKGPKGNLEYLLYMKTAPGLPQQ